VSDSTNTDAEHAAKLTEAIDLLATLPEIEFERQLRKGELHSKLGVGMKVLRDAVRKRRKELEAEERAKRAAERPHDNVGSLPYEADEYGFFVPASQKKNRVNVTNFTAWIEEHRRVDDGTGRENPNEVLMHGKQYGEPLPPVVLPSEKLVSTDWTKGAWSTTCVLSKEVARIAFDTYRQDEAKHVIIRTHTGWTKMAGEPAYLHAGGAITAEGLRDDVKVEPGGVLRDSQFTQIGRLRLPPPPDGDELAAAARASLGILDVGVPHVTSPVLALTYLAPLGAFVTLSMTGYVYGDTNAFKTGLMGIAQAHYGDFHREALPLSFHGSTPTGAEILSFVMKDALLTADDYRLSGLTHAEVARRQAILERLVRSSGDHSGGARANKDLGLRRDMPPRALSAITAETKISNASSSTRLALIRVSYGDIDLELLKEASTPENLRLYVLAMSGYLRWIARNWTALERTVGRRVTELAGQFTAVSSFARQPRNAALLMVGFETMLAFMLEAGAVEPERALEFRAQAEEGILGRAAEEAEAIEEQDAPRLFIDCLAGALSANNLAYVETIDGKEPPDPRRWGWSPQTHMSNGVAEHVMARPKPGICVGRIDPLEEDAARRLYLDAKTAFKVIRQFHRDLYGTEFAVSADTLWGMLAQRNLIDVTVETRGSKKIIRARTRKRMRAVGKDTSQSRVLGAANSGSAYPWVVALRIDVFDDPELSSRHGGGDSGSTRGTAGINPAGKESNNLGDSEAGPTDATKKYTRAKKKIRPTSERTPTGCVRELLFDCKDAGIGLKVVKRHIVTLGMPKPELRARIDQHQAALVSYLRSIGGRFPEA
jgi:hypothetical protein